MVADGPRARSTIAPASTSSTGVSRGPGIGPDDPDGATRGPPLARLRGPRSEEDLAKRTLLQSILDRQPPILSAIVADAAIEAKYRGENADFRSRWDAARSVLRLMIQTDALLGLALYRVKAGANRRGIPLLPSLAHRLAVMTAQVSIGDPVVVQPGIRLPHGQVVIDGLVEIESGVVIRPWVTIGLKEGDIQGPIVEERVRIGTGAKIIGPVRIGRGSQIGANAVVLSDVPANSTAVGVPARIVERKDTDA